MHEMDVYMYDSGYRLKHQQSFVHSLNFVINVQSSSSLAGYRAQSTIMAFVYNGISVDYMVGKIPTINSPFTADLVTRAEKASPLFSKILD